MKTLYTAEALATGEGRDGHGRTSDGKLDLDLAIPKEIAVVGPPDSEVARAALEPFDPNAVVAFGPAEGVPLLEGKDYVDGRPAVYVCERFACQRPVTDASELQPAWAGQGRAP